MGHHFSRIIHGRGVSACVHCQLPKPEYVDQLCSRPEPVLPATAPDEVLLVHKVDLIVQLGPIFVAAATPSPSRDHLVHLVSEGVPPAEIMRFFILRGMTRGEVDMLLYECGVFIHQQRELDDSSIAAERRVYLQWLSTQDD